MSDTAHVVKRMHWINDRHEVFKFFIESVQWDFCDYFFKGGLKAKIFSSDVVKWILLNEKLSPKKSFSMMTSL